MPPKPPMDRRTRRIALLARKMLGPSVVDACLRDLGGKSLLQCLLERGAITEAQAQQISAEALRTQKFQRLSDTSLPRLQNLRGEVLAGVTIGPVLGTGGTGTVYKGTDKTGRTVAVKVLDPRLAKRTKTKRRFFREARALQMIDDPSLVRVYGAGQDRGLCYLILEYVSRRNLADLVDKRPLTTRLAVRIGCQVAIGLEAAHDQGIVHRDVKPRNILVLANDEAKLADFGNAQVHQRTSRVVVGSVRYIAPEQLQDGPIDHRADLYSLGAVLFYSLTGRPPFEGETVVKVVRQHLSAPPPRLRSVLPAAPEELDGIVDRCLQKEPAQRFQSAKELRRALTACLAELG